MMSELSAFYLTSLTKGSNSAIKGKPSAAAGRITEPDFALHGEDRTAAGHGTVHYSTVRCKCIDFTLYFGARNRV